MISRPPPRLLDGGAAAEVEMEGRALRFHAVWLRDNAQDAATRSPANGQRLVTLLDIPPDIRVAQADWQDDRLMIRFAPGGERIAFDAEWLAAHAYDRPARADQGWTEPWITRWDGARAAGIEPLDYAAVAGTKDGLRLWLETVRRYGFARLTGVPGEPDAPARVAALFGHVRETNYGRVFDVRALAGPANLADTHLGLQVHTDNPYRDPPPGVQILLCLRSEAKGGETLLVDGFEAVERLRAETPGGFALLARHPARFAYAGAAGVRLEAKRPIVELGEDGELRALRFNNRSAAAFTDIPYEDMADYYAAYRRLAQLVDDPALALRFRLAPGDLFIVDNRRVLHGRAAITGPGERWLRGCYADLDGLLSTLAVLEA